MFPGITRGKGRMAACGVPCAATWRESVSYIKLNIKEVVLLYNELEEL